MMQNILYQDKLILLKSDSITLRYYYFPLFISKRIPYTDIEKIEMSELKLVNGKWRLWGSSIFVYWLPLDLLRPLRKKIFVITYKNKRLKSGFTVKDYTEVEKILKGKGLLA